MFQIISNPFAEMAQGVVSNGLDYIAERSEKSESFAWLWWIAGAILTTIGIILLSNYQKKKKEEEEQEKLAQKQKDLTS
jgi:hypothetical protein